MNSIYDKELHVSIPTVDYIKQRTGIDVIAEEGNETRALGKIYSLTTKARDFLFSNKLPITRRAISYLIYNGTWRELWEQYVLRYIEATFFYGDESAWEKTPTPILNAINGSMLSVKEFDYRTKHEVINSTEDF